MLQLNIKNMLASKGIDKPYAWLVKLKVNPRTAQKLLAGEQKLLPIKVLTRICEAAWCAPSDLFSYERSPGIFITDQHPLEALKPKPPIAFAPKLRKLSPEKLSRLSKMIDELGEE
ncbi:MAG: helix-turn-helix domain-containing protein [Chitinophagaceae bacterium]|nr:helix-turn-helix domain-containing protein [Chitinophagaceae bacterium]